MTKPIRPDEISKAKENYIPDNVIAAFNEVIAKHWSGTQSSFKLDDIVNTIIKIHGCKSKEIFDKKWLDVEDMYRQVGWTVVYDQPGYNESYTATFKFTK